MPSNYSRGRISLQTGKLVFTYIEYYANKLSKCHWTMQGYAFSRMWGGFNLEENQQITFMLLCSLLETLYVYEL